MAALYGNHDALQDLSTVGKLHAHLVSFDTTQLCGFLFNVTSTVAGATEFPNSQAFCIIHKAFSVCYLEMLSDILCCTVSIMQPITQDTE